MFFVTIYNYVHLIKKTEYLYENYKKEKKTHTYSNWNPQRLWRLCFVSIHRYVSFHHNRILWRSWISQVLILEKLKYMYIFLIDDYFNCLWVTFSRTIRNHWCWFFLWIFQIIIFIVMFSDASSIDLELPL